MDHISPRFSVWVKMTMKKLIVEKAYYLRGYQSKFYFHYTHCTNEKQQILLSFYPRWGTVGAGVPIRASSNPLKIQKNR